MKIEKKMKNKAKAFGQWNDGWMTNKTWFKPLLGINPSAAKKVLQKMR